MLDIAWPEVEGYSYSSTSIQSSEKKIFQLRLFKKLREKLNPKEEPENIVDISVDSIASVIIEGWDTLKVEDIMKLVESVIDYILPKIDLPGPDIIIRPLVKKAILSTTKPLAQKLLGII